MKSSDLIPPQNQTEVELLDAWRIAFDSEWFRKDQDRIKAALRALTELFRGTKTRRHHDGVIMHTTGSKVSCYRTIRINESRYEQRVEESYGRTASTSAECSAPKL